MRLGAAFQQLARQGPFLGQRGVDLLLYRATADELVHQHVPLLANAEGAIGGLLLDGRVPPAVEVDDVGGGREIEARAARLEREHEEGRLAGLEAVDESRTLAHLGLAVQDEAGRTEDLLEEGG